MQSYANITVGARNSPLSLKQVEEVYAELKLYHPHVVFRPTYVATHGDLDKNTSLRSLEKTDFFTREIDQMQIRGECRIAIHSAKDLPDPLHPQLQVVALTKGIDPSDSLVWRSQETLRENPVIATSSIRREENVRQLFPNARFVDIRGTIQEMLTKLFAHEMDGVVIAEAALIRLNLTHLNRCTLPGEPAPLQGRLAAIARKDDCEMSELFRCLGGLN